MAMAKLTFDGLLQQLAAEYDQVAQENQQLHAKLEGREGRYSYYGMEPSDTMVSNQRPDRLAVTISGRPSSKQKQLQILAAPTLYRLSSQDRVSLSSSEPLPGGARPQSTLLVSSEEQRIRGDVPSASDIRKSMSFVRRGLVINPETSAFLHNWDKIVLWATLYVVLVTPVEVALLTLRPVVDALFVLNTLVDVIFFTDMLLYFCIMFPKETDHGTEWECRPKAIAAKYLRTWFLIDAISLTPVRFTAFFFDEASQRTLKAISALQLLRLMRVLRLPRLIGRFQLHMSITYKELSLAKFFVILSILAHWLTCLWAFTLIWVGEGEGVPRWIDSIDELEVDVRAKTKNTPWKLYVACLYFTSYTMSSIGYGDIGPKNIVERLVCTFMVIISGVVWAVVLGQVSGIVANMDHSREAFQAIMDDLQLMMRERRVGQDMRQRLRDFFTANKTAQRRARDRRLLETLSPGLQGEVSLELNREWVARVHFLCPILHKAADIDGAPFRAFLADVSQALHSWVFAQSEVFGMPQVLYILNCGLVSRECRIYKRGSVWGVDFVLSDTNLVNESQSFALTYVETLSLGREDFFQVIETHRKRCPLVKRQIRRTICWLALQRAILKEARRRQRLAKRIRTRHSVLSDADDDFMSETPPVDADIHARATEDELEAEESSQALERVVV